MAQAFIEDHANTCCWTFFVARLLRKSQIATYFCLIKACRAYGGRRRVALGISESSHIISEHLGQPLWAGKEMSCCHFTNGDFGPQYCSWGGVRGNVNSFQLASEKKRQLKADESGWIWLHWLHSKTLSTQQTKPVMQGESSAVSPAVNWVHYLTGFTRW